MSCKVHTIDLTPLYTGDAKAIVLPIKLQKGRKYNQSLASIRKHQTQSTTSRLEIALALLDIARVKPRGVGCVTRK